MGRQFIAWRRQPQGVPNGPTIILSPRGGGRGIAGRVAAGAGWPGRTEIPRFRRWAWVCDLGPLSGARTGYAPETWASLNKNLALTLPFQLSMALVALFLPTATLASRNNSRACVHDIDDFLGSSPASRSNQSHPSH